MAIFSLQLKIICKSHGKSSVASSAYISASSLLEEETGKVRDYSEKEEVVYSEILLPKNAPKEFANRAVLWNSVQDVEKKANAQLARLIIVALPRELTRNQQIECVQNYIKDNFTNHGMIADWALHDKGDGNPHAHIMLSMRPLTDDQKWGAKSKSVFANDLDHDGHPIFNPSKPSYDLSNKTGTEKYRIPIIDQSKKKDWEIKHRRTFDLKKDWTSLKEVQATRTRPDKGTEFKWARINIPTTDWNNRQNAEIWRKSWADHCNRYLSVENQIDHRSYSRQGKDIVPTIHEGYASRKLEQNGIISDRASYNRAVIKARMERQKTYNKSVEKTSETIKPQHKKGLHL